jgi:hypothetical protein
MMEFLKHLLGSCGEPHGLLYMLYVFGAFIITMVKAVYFSMKWWIEDTIKGFIK